MYAQRQETAPLKKLRRQRETLVRRRQFLLSVMEEAKRSGQPAESYNRAEESALRMAIKLFDDEIERIITGEAPRPPDPGAR